MNLRVIQNKPHFNTVALLCLLYNRAEDGPTCIIIEALDKDSRRSRFTWLLNMDVKVNLRLLYFPFCA